MNARPLLNSHAYTTQSTHLVGSLGISVVIEEGSHHVGANDGQAFARLQLIGQRQYAGLLYVLFSIHTHQDQDLWSDGHQEHSGQRMNTYDEYIMVISNKHPSIDLSICGLIHYFIPPSISQRTL